MTVAQRTEMAATVLRRHVPDLGLRPVVLLAAMVRGWSTTPIPAPCNAALRRLPGDVNARLLAGLLNEADVRAGLAGRGIEVPAIRASSPVCTTRSATRSRYSTARRCPPSHAADLAKLEALLASAGRLARTERALRLPGAAGEGDVARRGRDWAQLRTEWGLAGCKGLHRRTAPAHGRGFARRARLPAQL